MVHRLPRVIACLVAALIGGSLLLAGAASAQQYPTASIRMLVGFGPGSTADIMARLVAKNIEQTLGQPVVVENHPGNSSMIAAEIVARAPKDGYTLFMGTVAQTLNPARMNSKFNLANDMTAVALLGVVPNLLATHPSVPAKNIKELVALARAKPESLTFGTSGAGTASHLAAELFNLYAGTKIVAVHYQAGSNQMLTDLLTGRVSMAFSVAATLTPHVKNGTLRAIAVAQPKRASMLPDVPTLAEEGMPGVDAGIWIGLLAPAGTPAAIVNKLSAAANATLKAPAAIKALQATGIDPLGSTPAEFDTFIKADIAKWVKVLKASGLTK